MPKKPKPKMPADLLDAFRVEADANIAAIAVLLIDDGFDAAVMRVLTSWTTMEVFWERPTSLRPEGGASAAAWRWLCSGLVFEWQWLVDASGVPLATAQRVLGMLLSNKLALPDGTISKIARAALQQHGRTALGLKPAKPDPAPKKTTDEGTN